MAVRRIEFNRTSPEPDIVDQVAEHILIGGLAIVPTDTVYGIIGDATAPPAAEAIFALKQRSRQEPLPLFVDHATSLAHWHINFPPRYMPVTEKFWPGPLTLIVPTFPDFYLFVGGNGKTVGVRETAEPIVYRVMRKTNRYLFATSANPAGADPAVVDLKPWLESASTETIIWCEPIGGYQPQAVSTVVDLTNKSPRVQRVGAISASELQKIMPDLQVQE